VTRTKREKTTLKRTQEENLRMTNGKAQIVKMTEGGIDTRKKAGTTGVAGVEIVIVEEMNNVEAMAALTKEAKGCRCW